MPVVSSNLILIQKMCANNEINANSFYVKKEPTQKNMKKGKARD